MHQLFDTLVTQFHKDQHLLHEKKGGYAFNKDSIKALETKSTSNGVQVLKGVKVTGFKRGSNSKAVTGVETDKGTIDCEQVVIGAGPWARDFCV